MQFINKDNIFDYAFINMDSLTLPVKAVCVDFHGYTDGRMLTESDAKAKLFGEKGIAWVFPYYSVWAWMSKSSQEFNEQVLDAVYRKLRIPDTVPLIITGGSMGGLTALCYQVYGKRKAVACAANCPVTDMGVFFRDFAKDRRAILSAHILDERPLETVCNAYSPVKLVEKMPYIPYMLIFGEKDAAITERFMPEFVEKMKASGHNVRCVVQKDMTHCAISSHKEALDIWCDFIVDQANSAK